MLIIKEVAVYKATSCPIAGTCARQMPATPEENVVKSSIHCKLAAPAYSCTVNLKLEPLLIPSHLCLSFMQSIQCLVLASLNSWVNTHTWIDFH